MKPNIHPDYRTVVFHDTSVDEYFLIGSTLKTDEVVRVFLFCFAFGGCQYFSTWFLTPKNMQLLPPGHGVEPSGGVSLDDDDDDDDDEDEDDDDDDEDKEDND